MENIDLHKEAIFAANQNIKERDYWLNKLSGELVKSIFPYDGKETDMDEYIIDTVTFSFPPELFPKLMKLVNHSDYRLHIALTAALILLLYKYTGSRDIIVGTPVYKQEVEGELVNTVLALRNQVTADISFKEFLLQVARSVFEANEHQNYPVEILLDNLNIPDPGHGFSLFDVSLLLENIHKKRYLQRIHCNMIFSFLRTSDGIEGVVEYNVSLYHQATIERIILHFSNVLQKVVPDVVSEVSRLDLLTEQEKKRLLFDFNNTGKEYPGDKTIIALFEEQVQRTPDFIAVVLEAEKLTYRELDTNAHQLAAILRGKGAKPGHIIGLMVERSIQMILGILAVLKTGAAYLPIVPEYPGKRIDYMLKDSMTRLLLTPKRFIEKIKEPVAIVNPDVHRLPEPLEEKPRKAASAPGDLVYVMYTSGSTGKPKAVMIEQASLINTLFALQEEYPFSAGDRYLLKTSFMFDVSATELYGWFLGGGRLVVLDKEAEKEPQKILDTIETFQISHINFVPMMFNVFVDFLDSQNTWKLRSLEYIFLAGEALWPEVIKKFTRLQTGIRLENLYGPTEAAVYAAKYSLQDWDESSRVPIGKPLWNTKLYILNKDNGLQPIGVPGELAISGHGLSRGYLNRVELTVKKFTVNPITGKERLYRTGDLARWLPDGNIEFLGRSDYQVKVRGYRIELGEIESRLLAHKDIKEAVVTARENGDGGKYLCAYIVSDKAFDVPELREYLSAELPGYMTPAYFVKLKKLPLNTNGKIDRNALPLPRGMELGSKVEYIAPSNALEKKLAAIWQDVLGRERIGVNDNFFETGGDSITTIQVAARMSTEGYRIEMRDIFRNPTIAKLAPLLKKREHIPDQSAISGLVPLTPIQHWFFENTFTDRHHFNQAVVLYAQEGFEADAIEAVFSKLQEHHDALRMIYREENGDMIQVNQAPDHPFSFRVFDYKNREDTAYALEAGANDIQASIDLENGPLMKVGLFHLEDGDRLLIVIHHLVTDGVSWRILLEDFSTLYRQYKNEEKLTLPVKTDSFKRCSEKLSEYANSQLFLKEKTYWKELESARIPVIEKDFEKESNCTKDTDTLAFSLSEEDTHSLLTRINEAFGTEINDILLISLGLAVRKRFGHHRLLVALEGHGREEILDVDISRTIGWFTCLYPVIFDLSYENDRARQIKEVKEALRRVPHKGIGYGILKYLTREELKRDLTFNLKPQIVFNYLGQIDTHAAGKGFEIAMEPPGNSRSLKGERYHEFEITGMTANKRLSISISFNKKHFKSNTVKALLDCYKRELIGIISYCREQEKKHLTPSDLTCKKLSIDELDRLTRMYPVKDVWPLSPMQEGFYFTQLSGNFSYTYFEQISYHLRGNLDAARVERSLNELLKRYDILRTAFIHETFDRPLQIVLKERKIDFYYKDIRYLADKEEKAAFSKRFKEQDAARSFDLGKDVLIRAAIFRETDEDYEFIWSFHHILMDGWCLETLISDFSEIYSGYLESGTYRLPEVKQFRDYLEWWEQQDKEVWKNYWKKYLAQFEEATVIPPVGTHTGNNGDYQQERVFLKFDSRKKDALNRLAVRNHVTLNIVIQTVWGIILGKYNNSQDVVFGIVVSGRPPELEGVEFMVGLFINSVPLRIRFNEDTEFNHLLRRVQEDVLNMNRHQYLSLAEIQSLSQLKHNLIDHALVFENYPFYVHNKAISEKLNIEMSDLEVFEEGNYDFFLSIYPREELSMSLVYNSNVYPRNYIKKIADHLEAVLIQIIEKSSVKIKDIKISQDLLLAKSSILEGQADGFRL